MRRRPSIILRRGARFLDEAEMAMIGTLREGKMVSVDCAQFAECQKIILDMLAEVYEVDPVAVLHTIERHLPAKGEKN